MRVSIFFILMFSFLLSGCAETQLASHVAKQWSGPPSKSQGNFKVGSPYKAGGKTYVPRETYNFTETGIASWYGNEFKGRRTANGEIFDPNELTAAHRTLQMPSLVRVTNLENGKSLIVRINDRGPFKRGRVIDLSRRAAELLGFVGNGTAKVKLQVLSEESKQIAMAARRGESTRGVEIAMNEGRYQPISVPVSREAHATAQPISYEQASLEPAHNEPTGGGTPPVSGGHLRNGNFLPDPVVYQMPVTPTNIYVQAGSFGSQDNAIKLAQTMQNFGNAQVYPAVVAGRQFHRVRLGPLATVNQADTLLARLASSGHSDAIIVVE